MKLRLKLTFSFLVCFLYFSFAQTGPGGVGNSTTNKLWLKADEINLANGALIPTWNDVSGNNHHASQSNSTYQCTLQTNQINGLPAVRFDGINDYFDDNHSYSARTVFYVYNILSANQQVTDLGQIWGNYADGAHLALDARNNPGTWSFDADNSVSNTGRLALNGAAFGAFNGNPSTPNWTYDQFDIVVGEFNATRNLTRQVLGSLIPSFPLGEHQYGGDVSEIIVYNTTLNVAQRIIVENYLAAKYNLTITNDLYVYQSTHGYDLAGIGRNSAGNTHTSATSAQLLTIENPNALADGDYLLFGHQNGDITSWTTTEAPGNGANIQRLPREWIVDETNEVGTVDISIDATTLPALPAGHVIYGLLVDADGDFSDGASVYELANTSGSIYQVPSVNLSSGTYLAIAAIRPVIEHKKSASNSPETTANPSIGVRLNYIPQTNVTVDYATSDGSATVAGSDYTNVSSTLTITAPDTNASYTLTINNDVLTETDENLTITLSNPSIGIIGTKSSHTFTIKDDDNPRKIYFDASTSSALESVTSGTIPVSINISDGTNPTTVDYTITAGTATGSGTDYTLSSGTLTITSGNTTNNIPFTINNDGDFEADETFTVTLSNPTNCNLDVAAPLGGTGFIAHTYTITNDDPAPEIQFTLASSSGDERDTPAAIQVQLSTTASADISADFTVTGTATGSGVDYFLANGTVTITTGNSTTNISIIINNDGDEELPETIILTLSNPVNGILGTNTQHVFTINDDDVTGRLGPGGVGKTDNLMLWLVADSINQANSTSVTNWQDVSGNNRNAAQGTASLQPTYLTNQVNGHAVVRFDGSNDYLTGSHSYDAQHVFAVFRMLSANQNTGDLGQLWGSYSEGVQFGPDARSGGGRWSFDGNDNTQGRVSVNGGAYGSFGENPTSPSWSYDVFETARVEFNSLKSVTRHDIGSLINPTGHLLGADIAEIAVFNFVLDEAQTLIIDNYFASKYNLTIANDIYPHDAPGNFEYEVAGIGRVNSSNFHLDAQGSGIVRILNPNDLDDNEFLIFGHNNALNTATDTTDIPGSLEGRLERVWRVSEVNASGTAVDIGSVDLHFDLTGFGPVNTSQLFLLIDLNNDGNFNDETPIAGASLISGSTYGFLGITGLSNNLRFTLGTSNLSQTPLPVELKSFSAKPTPQTVQLSWVSITEINLGGFEIQKSKNGETWETIKRVEAKGTSNTENFYQSTDENPYNRQSFYRLKMIDLDGTFRFSKVVQVIFNNSFDENFNIFPNPTEGILTVTPVFLEEEIPMVFNILGENLSNKITLKRLSENTIQLNIENLPKGAYFLKHKNQVLKFIKN